AAGAQEGPLAGAVMGPYGAVGQAGGAGAADACGAAGPYLGTAGGFLGDVRGDGGLVAVGRLGVGGKAPPCGKVQDGLAGRVFVAGPSGAGGVDEITASVLDVAEQDVPQVVVVRRGGGSRCSGRVGGLEELGAGGGQSAFGGGEEAECIGGFQVVGNAREGEEPGGGRGRAGDAGGGVGDTVGGRVGVGQDAADGRYSVGQVVEAADLSVGLLGGAGLGPPLVEGLGHVRLLKRGCLPRRSPGGITGGGRRGGGGRESGRVVTAPRPGERTVPGWGPRGATRGPGRRRERARGGRPGA